MREGGRAGPCEHFPDHYHHIPESPYESDDSSTSPSPALRHRHTRHARQKQPGIAVRRGSSSSSRRNQRGTGSSSRDVAAGVAGVAGERMPSVVTSARDDRRKKDELLKDSKSVVLKETQRNIKNTSTVQVHIYPYAST